jgi:hypothetical protein
MTFSRAPCFTWNERIVLRHQQACCRITITTTTLYPTPGVHTHTNRHTSIISAVLYPILRCWWLRSFRAHSFLACFLLSCVSSTPIHTHKPIPSSPQRSNECALSLSLRVLLFIKTINRAGLVLCLATIPKRAPRYHQRSAPPPSCFFSLHSSFTAGSTCVPTQRVPLLVECWPGEISQLRWFQCKLVFSARTATTQK